MPVLNKQLVNWFDRMLVTKKREDVSNLIKELVFRHSPHKLPLPEIAFPTLNGKYLNFKI